MSQILSEMAGTLIEVLVEQGDEVSVGQEVAMLESMKMEVPLESKVAGKVIEVKKNAGDFVSEGDVIIELS